MLGVAQPGHVSLFLVRFGGCREGGVTLCPNLKVVKRKLYRFSSLWPPFQM
jgi:hypothetical protein